MSYHKVIVVGNLSSEPEMKFTPDGKALTTFRMASNDYNSTTWWRVAVWGKQAEAAAEHLAKGRSCLVEGRMNCDKSTGGPRVWTDNSGNARAGYEINASQVTFLGGGSMEQASSPAPHRTESAPVVADDENIPF